MAAHKALSGVVSCPIFKPFNGKILSVPGYDPETYLLASFNPKEFKPVKEYPNRGDAIAARKVLENALQDFPFYGEDELKLAASKNVALAAMLTAVCRPCLPSCPMILFNASAPGTGKSTLADIISIIATGKRASAIDYVKDPIEISKSIFSLLLGGAQVALIDNIIGEFNSSSLCIVLSQEKMQQRVLGVSMMADAPTDVLFLVPHSVSSGTYFCRDKV